MRLSGSIPPLAESFHQRPETGLHLRAGLYPGDTVVLTHGEETPSTPAAQGGTGKTQLAVAFTHALWTARAVEALIWVSASSRDAIVTGFAQAAIAVGAADAGLGAKAAAAGFITWLAHTRRPWALILDDLASLDDLGGRWPTGPAGQVVITTRLPETAFRTGRTGTHSMPGAHSMPAAPGASGSYGPSGGYEPPGGYETAGGYGTSGGYEPSGGYGTSGSNLMPGGYGAPGGFGNQGAAGVTGAAGIPATPGEPRVAPVGGFSRREVLAYLGGRLTDFPEQRAEALELGADLDGLPLALAQAAAVMAVNQLSCAEYRGRLGERREHMSAIRVDGISPPVLATWSLAVECAHELPPSGAAWPALALAAMLDPNGIPGAVLTSPAGCGYVAGRPSGGDRADQALVRGAITNLARVGLISVDPASAVRTVRMHPSVQAAVRAYLPPADFEQAVLAAAEALLQAWPDDESAPRQGDQDRAERAQLELALRDGTAALWAADGAVLQPAEGGQHARHAARPQPGVPVAQPHQSMLWRPEAHPVLFRRGLSLDAGGLTGPAIAHWQAMLAAGTQLSSASAGHRAGQGGARDASAVLARDRLAVAYESAGRFGDAIAAFTSALAERERAHGTEHPDTITARGLLAHAYASAGRPAEAVTLYEQMVAGAGRQLGAGHPVTLAARASLAEAYLAAARGKDALAAYEALLADAGWLLGAGHAETLAARENLAAAYLASGQPKDAIEQYRQLVTATEATVGRDHPDAITARASLASAYRRGGKPKDAIALYRRVLADRARTAGDDHPDAIAARADLAFAYRSAGQLREAIAAYERTLADRERVQGPDHPDTRAARASLAAVYQQAGRLSDAVHHYEQALADSERMLGPGDLETLTARSALAAAHVADGRPSDAIPLLERALADSERSLGPDHPMTRTVRDSLEAATHG